MKKLKALSFPADIDNLIPHHGSMRFVDKIIYLADREAHVSFKIPENSPFIDKNGFIDEVVFLEMIAQAMATYAGVTGNSTPEKPLKGFLLGCKNFEVLGKAKSGDVLIIKGREQAAFGEFSIIDGSVYKDGALLASGEIKIWEES